jgi:crossover junction endodeoxyribonuclease RuvC
VRILGIDPGTRQTGFGIIQEEGRSLRFVDCGVIRTSSKGPLSRRLHQIYHELRAVIERYRPDTLSLENIFVARNVSSALKLGHARGASILAAVNHDVEVFEYSPAEVKKNIAGSGRADKQQVQQMVQRLLALPELPTPEDASDALALAICHSFCRVMQARLGTAAPPRARGRRSNLSPRVAARKSFLSRPPQGR